MKKIYFFLSIFIVVALACDLSINITPSSNTVVPQPPSATVQAVETSTDVPASATIVPITTVPGATSTFPLPPTNGTQVFYRPVSLVLPTGLASGISGSQFPRADGPDLPSWELTPGHTVVKLEGYLLQGKFHQPQIYVYPAMSYAELFPGAFESMHRLRNVINPVGPITADQLPAVPFFNAAQNFASNFQGILFQNGNGVRFLTQYDQYPAPINNNELFYHFQGFTSDGEYYIIAIFPVTIPVLADTSDAGAVLPPGGVAYPDITSPNPDMRGYYASITDLLNVTPSEAFSPSINQLDALIQSMNVTP